MREFEQNLDKKPERKNLGPKPLPVPDGPCPPPGTPESPGDSGGSTE